MANIVTKRATRSRLLRVALQQSEAVGWSRITRESVATAARVAPGTVSYRFGSMQELRDAVMAEAVTQACLAVIAEGIAAGSPAAMAAPASLRRQAIAVLLDSK